MKVLLINGSPHKNGCTYTALCEAEKVLREANITTEVCQLGTAPIRGCTACGACVKLGRCAFGEEDGVNELLQKLPGADGFIFGSPVHYAAAGGSITSLLDRLFYAGGKYLSQKPGAAVVSCRRGGASAALDQLNKYFMFNQMPVASGNYWNMVHGNTPAEVLQDEEGLQTVRVMAKNMAWLLRCIEAGKNAGVTPPVGEAKIKTNFIR
ncbi:MAG: flavodoxin family protein [Oscillospiraceae bacterium]|nr:flavodoxin family protein [Oscillospiraceae bacterium]